MEEALHSPTADHQEKLPKPAFLPKARVKSVRFKVPNENDIRGASASQTVTDVLSKRRIPNPGGLLDPLQGTTNRKMLCLSCDSKMMDCMGHSGHLELMLPVPNPLYINYIIRTLQCVCFHCSRMLLPSENPGWKPNPKKASKKELRQHDKVKDLSDRAKDVINESSYTERLKQLAKLSERVMVCGGNPNCKFSMDAVMKGKPCGGWQPSYTKLTDTVGFSISWDRIPEENRPNIGDLDYQWQIMDHVYKVLSFVSPEHAERMGSLDGKIGHPQGYFIKAMDVPPPFMRPSREHTEGDGHHGQDDLTYKLQSIVRANRTLQGVIEATPDGKESPDPSLALKKRAKTEDTSKPDKRDDFMTQMMSIDGALAGLRKQGKLPSEEQQLKALEEQRKSRKKKALFARGRAGAWRRRTRQRCLEDEAALSKEEKIERNYTHLVVSVATFIDQKYAAMLRQQNRKKQPTKDLVNKLKGKTGMFRGNTNGKRGNLSARDVITPDSHLRVGQFGVPQCIARVITVKEEVNNYNIHRLSKMVRNGPDEWPGANYVYTKSKSGKEKRISLHGYVDRTKMTLVKGWMVERHLMSGDRRNFNRQPTLHRPNIMSHEVYVYEDPFRLTFGLPPDCTQPYNADFDGDEMNLTSPTTPLARAEGHIMAPKRHIISAKNGQPIISFVQDPIVSAWRLTSSDRLMDLDQFMQCLSQCETFYCDIPSPSVTDKETGEPRWTGRQLFSCLLPSDMYLFIKAPSSSEDPVRIEKGILLSGRLGKSQLKRIIRVMHQDFGPDVAEQFIMDAQLMLDWFITTTGFSLGIGDCDNPIKQRTEELLDRAEAFANSHRGEEHEERVCRILNRVRDQIGAEVIQSLRSSKRFNGLLELIDSGSKGTPVNLSQIVACVGQQFHMGQRIVKPLPHFHGDDDAVSSGFVRSSYSEGLKPWEYFPHAQAGQEGLVNTAVKTADTGYLHRKMQKAQESMIVDRDLSVRTSHGQLLQQKYGDTGWDPRRVEYVLFPSLRSSDDELDQGFSSLKYFSVQGCCSMKLDTAAKIRWMSQKKQPGVRVKIQREAALLKAERDSVRERLLFTNGTVPRTVQSVVPFGRIMKRAQFHEGEGQKISDLTPVEVVDTVNSFLQHLHDQHVRHHEKLGSVFPALVHSWFASARIVESGITSNGLRWALQQVERNVAAGTIAAHSPVGLVAGQSTAEPATQMNLNTFHFTGSQSAMVTMGVPRLKEIAEASENTRTPTMRLRIRPEVVEASGLTEAQFCGMVARSMPLARPEDVVIGYSVHFVPDRLVAGEAHPEDQPLLDLWAPMLFDDNLDVHLTQYVIRIEFDKERCSRRILPLTQILQRIMAQVMCTGDKKSAEHEWVHSTVFDDKWVLRLRLDTRSSLYLELASKQKKQSGRPLDQEWLMHVMARHILHKVKVHGIVGIDAAFTHLISHECVNPATGVVEKKTQHVIDTNGSNFEAIRRLPEIDWANSVTNDLHEIRNRLGVAAAQAWIEEQLNQVMEHSGSKVNPCHFKSIASVMTADGCVDGMNRYGVMNKLTSTLTKSSFETPKNFMVEAAAFGIVDTIKNVTEHVTLGHAAPIGTGCVTVTSRPLDENEYNSVSKVHQENRKSMRNRCIEPNLESPDAKVWEKKRRNVSKAESLIRCTYDDSQPDAYVFEQNEDDEEERKLVTGGFVLLPKYEELLEQLEKRRSQKHIMERRRKKRQQKQRQSGLFRFGFSNNNQNHQLDPSRKGDNTKSSEMVADLSSKPRPYCPSGASWNFSVRFRPSEPDWGTSSGPEDAMDASNAYVPSETDWGSLEILEEGDTIKVLAEEEEEEEEDDDPVFISQLTNKKKRQKRLGGMFQYDKHTGQVHQCPNSGCTEMCFGKQCRKCHNQMHIDRQVLAQEEQETRRNRKMVKRRSKRLIALTSSH